MKPEVEPQTIDGVTTQIDWAYADEGRIAIHYTISGLDWPDGNFIDPMQGVQINSTLFTDQQMGASGGNRSLVQQGVITGEADQMLIDGALDQAKHPNIRVRVSIPVEGPTKVGNFRFDLDLPVLPGITFQNIDQTVLQNNVAMTLRSLRLTPSYAEAILCFQMPSQVDWGLSASKLTIHGKEYPVVGGGAVHGEDGKYFAVDDPLRCSSIGFDVVTDKSADSIKLTVPKLTSIYPEVVTQDRVDRANQLLADAGIEFQYVNQSHGGTVEILKRPEGKSDEEIYPLIRDALSDQYEGPWVFKVPIQR
jgi:hypothetical protein